MSERDEGREGVGPATTPESASAGAAMTAREEAHAEARRARDAAQQVRASDIEPDVGLRYLSKLFRLMAIIMLILLLAEVVTGIVSQGVASIPTLLGEISRLIVLASLLWAMGDLAVLLIDIGHDVRATRILLGRQAPHGDTRHVDREADDRVRPRAR